MRTSGRWLLCLALVVTMAGCRPSEPSPSAWRDDAGQSLEDVASELATAQVALRAERRGQLLARTGVVLLADAEESAGSTVEKFTALQPPRGFERRHTEVSDAIENAAALVTEARSARVREDRASYQELGRRLASERSTLESMEERFR